MDQLAKSQESTGQEIQQIIKNYRKDPSDRKTKGYYEERLRRLESAWDVFDNTDNQIRSLPEISVQHEYFTTKYYETISDLHETYRTHFTQKIESLQGDSTSVPQSKERQVKQDKPPQDAMTSKICEGDQDKTSQIRKLIKSTQILEPTSADVSRAMRRQRGIIQSLRRFISSNIDTDEKPPQHYQVILQTINEYWKQVEELNHSIWELAEDPNLAGYDVDEYFRLEDEIHQHQISLSTKIGDHKAPSTTTHSVPAISTTLQLPQITLPKFDGEYLKWRQFADLFNEMVHKQPMANVQKMWYLKMNVTGDAEKLIRHLTLSEDNYSAAWKMLQERYENRRLLVTALVNKLLTQPSHASENASANSLKTLHDTTQECLMGLENLNIPTSNWDPLLLPILIKKLDRSTHTLYEQALPQPKEVQTIENFLQFLQTRFQSLEALGTKTKYTDHSSRNSTSVKSLSSVVYRKPSFETTTCVSCKGTHPLFKCSNFLKLPIPERLTLLRQHNLCVNCMKPGHNATKCTLRGCTKCNKKHNTLVHLSSLTNPGSSTNFTSKPCNAPVSGLAEGPTVASLTNKRQLKYVLLSTVRVKLTSNNGKSVECRAVLDSGSQVNLITERLVKKLGLKQTNDSLRLQGIGGKTHQIITRINVAMHSTTNGFTTQLEAFVLPRIISPQPTQPIDTSSWTIPKNIQLADPNFHHPGYVDLLIGAEFYPQILSIGQIKLNDEGPTLQNTLLGWIVTGKVNAQTAPNAICGILSENESINHQIEKFWKLEEIVEEGTTLTQEERRCENHFAQTLKRSPEGRFLVRLPFKETPKKLGESRDIAMRRFVALERRLAKNPEIRQQYIGFMDDYLRLGHMEPVELKEIEAPCYFMPHHCVLKPDSSTTKLRVVFDASAKTSSNVSLNDILCSGPTIQDDLFSILLRFRMPRFVFTADIQKMYRQILLDKEDRRYHMILWRDHPDKALKAYQLCTVTYGTTSAPYLATKCLQRLSEEGSERFPMGSEVLKNDFYVDDVITGSNSMTEALEKQDQLVKLLGEAGFVLKKWCANHPRLLRDIKLEDQEVQLDFANEGEQQIKTLGMTWLPKSDQFCIRANVSSNERITKRIVASEIARLFDPLGIMGPVIVTAKMFLQELWQIKLDWDAALPQELHTKWIRFRDSLASINDIQFPRHVTNDNWKEMQIHAFADASEKAYGAAVYSRTIDKNGVIVARLLCAKSRVAPLKKITIPRLELCAANLAVQLANRVKEILKAKNTVTHFWTDSEIVLSWINSEPPTLQTFVANRVSSIQSMSMPQQWRHVGTKENPADVLSRGISPEKFRACNLWFHGPLFLHGKESMWPPNYITRGTCNLERKQTPVSAIINKEHMNTSDFLDEINHGNSFRKVQRVIAYALRFINNARRLSPQGSSNLALTTSELDQALRLIVRKMQAKEFCTDIKHLRRYNEVNIKSSIANLAPFLDENQVIRVGGRLQNSKLSYDAQHQMLLPYSHQFTKLLLTDLHKENLHVGPQTLLSITRQRFWPIKGKSIARSVIQHCVRCVRAKPKMLSQLMGNLPGTRVQPARPFVNAGVDFCGPIMLHYKLRGKRPCKGYIAVFCCFATKAVHFEVVSDLTTDAFLAALKRFVSRRGNCLNLYCDNATNFVGARNQLEELKNILHSERSREIISTTCSSRGINFHFIPPRAPHFGGLWEAAVKSAKHLMMRCITSASLTYEELETVVVGIEAVLNSRPLTAMSNDPNDLSALTPGHFLIGEPLTSTIDSRADSLKVNLHNRWRLITQLKEEFWRRWSKEYLNELQYRYKWKQRCQNVQPGTIVILKEDNLPVMKWPLGRIIKIVSGDDGCVRVAEVKTSTGILRRPIHRLSPLPCEQDISVDDQPASPSDEEEIQEFREKRKCDSGSESIDTDELTKNAAVITEDTKSNESPRKRVRQSTGFTLTSLLLTCLLIPAIKADPIETVKFDGKPGLRFDKLGSMHVVSSDWNIVVYYDLQYYWLEHAALNNGTYALHHLCSQIKSKSTCKEIISQIAHIKNDLDKDNEVLNREPDIRQRRSALNIVGNVANSLFGVLDSEYAERMSKTIDDINQNENHLLSLIKNQTSLVDSTMNIMKRDQLAAEEKFRALDNQLTQIINRINDTGTDSYQQKLQQLFLSLSIQLTLIITSLQRVQSSILDVLTDTHHGKISPLLLSPHQLAQELISIKGHLPPTVTLPAGQDELLHLYQLMIARGRVVNEHVIFQIKLPLINTEEFEFYKILPIPFPSNEALFTIEPDTTYLAVNRHRDRYYPISEQEFMSCASPFNSESYICHPQHPIYHRGYHLCKCELELLNDSPIQKECTIKKIKDTSMWIQTVRSNEWIYALKDGISITAVCGSKTITMSLQGSGLLKLEPTCVIKHGSLTIQGHQNHVTSWSTSYHKLSHNFNTSIAESIAIPTFSDILTYKTQRKELDFLHQQLAAQQLELPKVISGHTSHSIIVGYSGLLLIITVIIFIITRIIITKRRARHLEGPTPKPRFTKNLDFSVNV